MSAAVAPDGNTEPLAKDSVNFIGTGIRRKQACRLVSICTVVLLFLMVPILIVQWIVMSPTQTFEFDARVPLRVTLSGCDVVLTSCANSDTPFDPLGEADEVAEATEAHLTVDTQPCSQSGSKGKIYLRRKSFGVAYTELTNTETGLTESLSVNNNDPTTCGSPPSNLCSEICHVAISVPKGAHEVIVLQDGSDKSPTGFNVKVIGVEMEAFTLSGHHITLRTNNAVLTKNLWASTGSGSITVVNSDLKAARLHSLANSVYFIMPDDTTYNADVFFRSQSSFGCFSVAEPSASIEVDPDGIWGSSRYFWADSLWSKRGSSWGNCELGIPSDPGSRGAYSGCAKALIKHYDEDGNLKITEGDFAAGVDKLGMCCGSGCPFYGDCAKAHKSDIIPWPMSYTSAEPFVRYIRDSNETMLVPGLHRHAAIRVPGATETREFKLTSGQGTIYFAHGGEPKVPMDTDFDDKSSMHTFEITEGGSGDTLRLLKRDADAITKGLRDVYGYGPVTSDGETPAPAVWAVIDVMPSPGIPAARFVYSNSPYYSVLEPALMDFITFSALTPKIEHYKAHFTYPGCTASLVDENNTIIEPGITPTNGASYLSNDATYRDNDVRLTSMASQLYKALIPKNRISLWGGLYYMAPAHTLEKPAIFSFRTNAGEPRGGLTMFEVVRSFESTYTGEELLALALSVFVGAVVGITLVRVLDKTVTDAMKKAFAKQNIRLKVLDARLQKLRQTEDSGKVADKNEAEESKEARGNIEEADSSDHSIKSALFERPIDVIDELLVNPIVRKYTDSFDLFVHNRCERDKGAIERCANGLAGASGFAIAFSLSVPSAPSTAEDKDEEQAALGLEDEDDDASAAMKDEDELLDSRTLQLKNFMKRYERFCSNNSYNFEKDTLTVKQRLTLLGIQPKQRTVERVFNVCWRSNDPDNPETLIKGMRVAPQFDYSKICEEIHNAMSEEAIANFNPSVEEMLELFITCGKFVKVTGNAKDFISYSDMMVIITPPSEATKGHIDVAGPQRERRDGFKSAFVEFCIALGAETILSDLKDMGCNDLMKRGTNPLDSTLEGFHVMRITQRVINLRGLKLKTFKKEAQIGAGKVGLKGYSLEFVKVAIHALIFMIPAIILLTKAVQTQMMWERTSASGSSLYNDALTYSQATNPLVLFKRFFDGGFGYTIDAMFYIAFVYACVALSCITVSYVGKRFWPFGVLALLPSPISRVFTHLINLEFSVHPVVHFMRRMILRFALEFVFQIVAIWLCINLVWSVLAALLDPGYYLPVATMIVTSITIVVWQYKRLSRMAKEIEFAIKEQYKLSIRKAVTRLIKTRANIHRRQMQQKILEKQREIEEKENEQTTIKRRVVKIKQTDLEAARAKKEEADVKTQEEEEDDDFDSSVLFELLDQDQNGYLTLTEFNRLFDELDIEITQGRKEQMFAYTDSDQPDSKISREEFVQSWEWLESELVGEISGQLGLSPAERVASILTLFVTLGAFFAFLYVAINAFNTSGGFVATVQSTVAAAGGKAAMALGKKPKAEELKEASPEELKKYIKVSLNKKDE